MSRYLQAFSILFYLGSGVLLCAQELRQIEFTVYGQYPIRGDVEYQPVGKEAIAAGAKAEDPVSVRTHSLSRTGPYSYKGGNRISFYDSLSNETVGEVTLPQGSTRWLLVFVKNTFQDKGSANVLKYKIYPFDDSRRNLPGNGLVFLNLSGMALSGKLGDETIELTPGESEPFLIAENLQISLWTPDHYKQKLLPAHIKNYSFQRNHRYLMILFPPVLKGSADIDVRFLNEPLKL